MKILILGGTGAMGAPLVETLLASGNEVYVTSRTAHEQAKGKKEAYFIMGDAHNYNFIRQILTNSYDIIVDFMYYSVREFKERVNLLLRKCQQYVFLSSARVYAPSKEKLTEESIRLLDGCKDKDYLETEEYALTKAREENILLNSQHKNWTIIRPYITYNDNRLQLGIFEKEKWLYRAINGRSIVFSAEIAEKITTLTYGLDVSNMIAQLIGKESALGEIIQITTSNYLKWGEVLEIYLNTLKKITGKRPKVYSVDSVKELGSSVENPYQWLYDRKYNRKFSNDKIFHLAGRPYNFIPPEDGLAMCLSNFLSQKELNFKSINWRSEAYMDRLTGEKTPISEIPEGKDKLIYIIARYTPFFDKDSLMKKIGYCIFTVILLFAFPVLLKTVYKIVKRKYSKKK